MSAVILFLARRIWPLDSQVGRGICQDHRSPRLPRLRAAGTPADLRMGDRSGYTASNPQIGTVMARALEIGDRFIGDDEPCFVIAEIGHNHGGNLDTCKQMFRAAAECGADAVKLQKRDNRTLFTRQMYESVYNSENAYAPTYGEHREKLEDRKSVV